jgi:hypothetical protein
LRAARIAVPDLVPNIALYYAIAFIERISVPWAPKN